MLADRLRRTDIDQVVRLLMAAGLENGYAYTVWSDTDGATDFEDAVLVSDAQVAETTPALCLAHGGEWFCALEQGGGIRVYRSRQHLNGGSWQHYQTVE